MDLVLYSRGAKLRTIRDLILVTDNLVGAQETQIDPRAGFVVLGKGSALISQDLDPVNGLVSLLIGDKLYTTSIVNFEPVSASKIFPADIAAIYYNFCKRKNQHAITVVMKNGGTGTAMMMPNDTFDPYVGYCIALEKARDGEGSFARKQALAKMTDKAVARGKSGCMLFIQKKRKNAAPKPVVMPKTPRELEAIVAKRLQSAHAKWSNKQAKMPKAEPAVRVSVEAERQAFTHQGG